MMCGLKESGMMQDQDDPWAEYRRRREEWRAQRKARREAWRARREEHRARWAHLGDPAFWGLDGASMRGMGVSGVGMGHGAPSEVEALKAKVEEMTRTIASLHERIIVLEKLAVGSDDARLAAEIEKLRGEDR
jgi:hypothetical protein